METDHIKSTIADGDKSSNFVSVNSKNLENKNEEKEEKEEKEDKKPENDENYELNDIDVNIEKEDELDSKALINREDEENIV